jgi:hypothetical protein
MARDLNRNTASIPPCMFLKTNDRNTLNGLCTETAQNGPEKAGFVCSGWSLCAALAVVLVGVFFPYKMQAIEIAPMGECPRSAGSISVHIKQTTPQIQGFDFIKVQPSAPLRISGYLLNYFGRMSAVYERPRFNSEGSGFQNILLDCIESVGFWQRGGTFRRKVSNLDKTLNDLSWCSTNVRYYVTNLYGLVPRRKKSDLSNNEFRPMGRNEVFSGENHLVFDGAESFFSGPHAQPANYSERNGSESYETVRDSGPPVGFGVVYLFAAALFFGGFGLMGYALFAFKGACRGVLVALAVIIMFFGVGSLIWWGVLCDRCNGKSENCAGVKKQAEDSEKAYINSRLFNGIHSPDYTLANGVAVAHD